MTLKTFGQFSTLRAYDMKMLWLGAWSSANLKSQSYAASGVKKAVA